MWMAAVCSDIIIIVKDRVTAQNIFHAQCRLYSSSSTEQMSTVLPVPIIQVDD